ncbi:hypothetical protein E2C01_018841 [Portunus trituberculatus]|uniref:Uncharacterized protein n=1 Tax=Portunus trituberculatus TaxID=210409 RepID=A0A5B7DXA3_PORTR|nr:hypothetical protein [Portunus trituberculatus]
MRKCFLIFWDEGKENPYKFMRELAKTIIKQVQDSTQELD